MRMFGYKSDEDLSMAAQVWLRYPRRRDSVGIKTSRETDLVLIKSPLLIPVRTWEHTSGVHLQFAPYDAVLQQNRNSQCTL